MSFNVARNGTGKPPSAQSCSEGKWLSSINKKDDDHDVTVIFDDREHEKGNRFGYLTANFNGAAPIFPMVFLLDHNGKVVNKKFQKPGLSAITKAAKEQEEVYDEALEKALKAKKDAGDDKKDDSSKDED